MKTVWIYLINDDEIYYLTKQFPNEEIDVNIASNIFNARFVECLNRYNRTVTFVNPVNIRRIEIRED